MDQMLTVNFCLVDIIYKIVYRAKKINYYQTNRPANGIAINHVILVMVH